MDNDDLFGKAFHPFKFRVELFQLMVLVKVAATAGANGTGKSASVLIAKELRISSARITEALKNLETLFGEDLQVFTTTTDENGEIKKRRTGQLTEKGRALGAAAGVLLHWMVLIGDKKTDHKLVLKYLNDHIDKLLAIDPETWKRQPVTPQRF